MVVSTARARNFAAEYPPVDIPTYLYNYIYINIYIYIIYLSIYIYIIYIYDTHDYISK